MSNLTTLEHMEQMALMEFDQKLLHYLIYGFGLTPEILELTFKYEGMIAGGFAAFLYANRNLNETYDGDIDIWVPCLYSQFDESKIIKEFTEYLNQHQYVVNIEKQDKRCQYSAANAFGLRTIKLVKYFINSNGKEVQLILTETSNDKTLNTFDLSFCQVGYTNNGLHCREPVLTAHKIGYMTKEGVQTKKRIKKYASRNYAFFDTRAEAVAHYKNTSNGARHFVQRLGQEPSLGQYI